jgi:hypothetical protein
MDFLDDVSSIPFAGNILWTFLKKTPLCIAAHTPDSILNTVVGAHRGV